MESIWLIINRQMTGSSLGFYWPETLDMKAQQTSMASLAALSPMIMAMSPMQDSDSERTLYELPRWAKMKSEMTDFEGETTLQTYGFSSPKSFANFLMPQHGQTLFGRDRQCQIISLGKTKFIAKPTYFDRKLQKGQGDVNGFSVCIACKKSENKHIKQFEQMVLHITDAIIREEYRMEYLTKQSRLILKAEKEAEWMKADHIQLCSLLSQIQSISLQNPVSVSLNNWINLSFSLQDASKHPRQSLRPFHTLLVLPHPQIVHTDSFLQDPNWTSTKSSNRRFLHFQNNLKERVLDCLPSDCSFPLKRIVNKIDPLKDLETMSYDTEIALPTVYKISGHLMYWQMVKCTETITKYSRFCIHPEADLSDFNLMKIEILFHQIFPDRGPIEQELRQFHIPKPLLDFPEYRENDSCQLTNSVIFFLQFRLLKTVSRLVEMAGSSFRRDGRYSAMSIQSAPTLKNHPRSKSEPEQMSAWGGRPKSTADLPAAAKYQSVRRHQSARAPEKPEPIPIFRDSPTPSPQVFRTPSSSVSKVSPPSSDNGSPLVAPIIQSDLQLSENQFSLQKGSSINLSVTEVPPSPASSESSRPFTSPKDDIQLPFYLSSPLKDTPDVPEVPNASPLIRSHTTDFTTYSRALAGTLPAMSIGRVYKSDSPEAGFLSSNDLLLNKTQSARSHPARSTRAVSLHPPSQSLFRNRSLKPLFDPPLKSPKKRPPPSPLTWTRSDNSSIFRFDIDRNPSPSNSEFQRRHSPSGDPPTPNSKLQDAKKTLEQVKRARELFNFLKPNLLQRMNIQELTRIVQTSKGWDYKVARHDVEFMVDYYSEQKGKLVVNACALPDNWYEFTSN